MTIDDYIDTYKSYAKDYRKETYNMGYSTQQIDYARDKAREYEQLAVWLEELQFLRQWKADIMEEFGKYDCNSVEEAIHNGYIKGAHDLGDKIVEELRELSELADFSCGDDTGIVYANPIEREYRVIMRIVEEMVGK